MRIRRVRSQNGLFRWRTILATGMSGRVGNEVRGYRRGILALPSVPTPGSRGGAGAPGEADESLFTPRQPGRSGTRHGMRLKVRPMISPVHFSVGPACRGGPAVAVLFLLCESSSDSKRQESSKNKNDRSVPAGRTYWWRWQVRTQRRTRPTITL